MSHRSKRVLLRLHEVVDTPLEDSIEDQSLTSEVWVVIRACKYDFVSQVEQHDQISTPTPQQGLIPTAKPRIETYKHCIL